MGRPLYTVLVAGIWLLAWTVLTWLVGGLWRPITLPPGTLLLICAVWGFAAQLFWNSNERLYAEFRKTGKVPASIFSQAG